MVGENAVLLPGANLRTTSHGRVTSRACATYPFSTIQRRSLAIRPRSSNREISTANSPWIARHVAGVCMCDGQFNQSCLRFRRRIRLPNLDLLPLSNHHRRFLPTAIIVEIGKNVKKPALSTVRLSEHS